MPNEENTAVSACIGTFDQSGIPIAITKHLSDSATIAFQAITLNMLIGQYFELGAVETVSIKHKDGFGIHIDRNLKGFIGYVSTNPQLNE